jgi:HK97 family phage major capsid protein
MGLSIRICAVFVEGNMEENKEEGGGIIGGMDYSVKIISQDDDTAVVGGYGVIFGGMDVSAERDTFTKDTDFMLDLVPEKPVMYDHGLTEIKHFLGAAPNTSIKIDDKGLWVESQLDRHREYVEEVLKLIESGALGYSSGSVPHLVQRAQKSITQWPIIEFSLTPTPAEPRTVGIERIKSLAAQDERFKAFLPEDGVEPSADAKPEAEGEIKQQIDTGDNQMSEKEVKEEVKAVPQGATLDEIKGLFNPVIERIEKLEKQPAAKAPAVLSMGRGDNELKAFAAFMKGQGSGNVTEQGQEAFELKASNATDMNITTDADGGYAVPVGLFDQIIARRDEMSLTSRLGCRLIPGIGTTVNVVVDNEADGEFVSTAEANQFDLDAPALTEKAFTLVKYTKRMLMSYELLEDSPVAIFNFVVDWVGRGMAKTNNGLLLTEAAASGTSLKTFGSATAIAQGELEAIAYNDALDPYLDDSQSVAWVMKKSVRGEIASLVGDFPQYGMHDNNGRTLLGEDVAFSNSAGATVASAKSVYFGNWNYMGYRESPSLTFIRNPYLRADYGQMAFHWHYRTVYGVLQAEAIGYGEHPSA